MTKFRRGEIIVKRDESMAGFPNDEINISEKKIVFLRTTWKCPECRMREQRPVNQRNQHDRKTEEMKIRKSRTR